ncbi:MAG: hypothetical protein KBD25_06265 [Rickettsiaceae bacterium]|nr:hypothetical protein [Rickettsiaceae bacterium]
MILSKKLTMVALIATSIILIILARYSYLANIIIHTLIDIFAGGRSMVKVDLFFVYLIFLASLSLGLTAGGNWRIRIPAKWLLASVAVVFIYSLSLLVVFYQRWGISPKNFVLIFNNNEITSTMILHNHLMKGFNGWLLSLFGSARQENLDTGYALFNLLPTELYILGGLLVIVVAIMFLLKFVELYKQQSGSRVWFVILYSIVTFSLLKNMLDGGILNREAPIAIAGLIALLWFYDYPAHKSNRIARGIFYSFLPLILYGVIVVVLWQAHLIVIDLFVSTLFPIVVFAALLANLIWWWKNGLQAQSKIGAALLFSLLVLLYFPVSNSVSTYFNSRRLVSSQGVWVGLYNQPNGLQNNLGEWTTEEKINDLTIYKLQPQLPTRIKDVIRNNNLVGNYSPISVEGYNCMLIQKQQPINFTLRTMQPLQMDFPEYRFGRLLSATIHNVNNGIHEYKVVGELNPCAPRKLNILRELLYLQGQEPFLITNIQGNYGDIE